MFPTMHRCMVSIFELFEMRFCKSVVLWFDLFRKSFLIFGTTEQAFQNGVTVLAKIDFFKKIACFKFDIFHFVNVIEG